MATRPLSMKERALTSTETWRNQLNLKFLLEIRCFVMIQSWHDKYSLKHPSRLRCLVNRISMWYYGSRVLVLSKL